MRLCHKNFCIVFLLTCTLSTLPGIAFAGPPCTCPPKSSGSGGHPRPHIPTPVPPPRVPNIRSSMPDHYRPPAGSGGTLELPDTGPKVQIPWPSIILYGGIAAGAVAVGTFVGPFAGLGVAAGGVGLYARNEAIDAGASRGEAAVYGLVMGAGTFAMTLPMVGPVAGPTLAGTVGAFGAREVIKATVRNDCKNNALPPTRYKASNPLR